METNPSKTIGVIETEAMTCSVQEFAKAVGISRDRAYELVHSEFPPPGFRVGKGYRVITSRIGAYMDALYERELESRRARAPRRQR